MCDERYFYRLVPLVRLAQRFSQRQLLFRFLLTNLIALSTVTTTWTVHVG